MPAPPIEYTIRRSDRARRVRVTVHPEGEVEVVLPQRAREREAAAASHEPWAGGWRGGAGARGGGGDPRAVAVDGAAAGRGRERPCAIGRAGRDRAVPGRCAARR